MNRRYTFSTSAVEELLNDIFGEYTTYSYYENFYILYATSLTANYFTAAGNQETVTVGNNNNKRYLKICSSTSASNPIYFYSVTYNYLDGSTSTIYVPSGTEITLPGNSISWENDSTGTKYSSGTTYTVTGKTSFTETSYSVSYVYLDGTTYTDTVELNDIIYLRTTAYGWTTNYSDYYDSGEQYEVLASVTFYEAAYNITYEYLDG
ncbi:MAG: hypothetical protein LUF26_09020, partial [Firmicutes bacterium]|nr:hypothetical protein [Bacillota bacterium]